MESTIDKLIVSDLDKGEDFWSFKQNCDRDYVHNLFAYPAMMVPKMQREIINTFRLRMDADELIIFDPFMGSGTILVEGMLQGANIIGVDINPLAYLVSETKTTIYSIDNLKKSIKNLCGMINTPISSVVITNFNNISKWFKKDIILELDHIKTQIKLEPSKKIRKYFWTALSETIRSVSNSRSSTYKLHIKAKKDISDYNKSAIEVFCQVLKKNLNSTIEFQRKLEELGNLTRSKGKFKYNGKIKLYLEDTLLKVESICKENSPNLIITSPPYGDNHTTVTYGQYSVLALRWIELKDIDDNVDESLVETLSKIDTISMGGTIKTNDNNKVLNHSDTLRKNIEEIKVRDKTKIDKVVSFYSDFYFFIEKLSKVKSDSYVIMTVGNRSVAKNRIEMDKILVEYFEHFSFAFVHKFKRNILNKRMPNINHRDKVTGEKIETMTKEYVLILKKR